MRILLLFVTLLLILPASNVYGGTHSIHIEWDYDAQSIPIDAELSAYRLYKDGVRVCQFDYPYDFAGDCEFTSNNGIFDFALTAVFDDGTESPRSTSYPFMLGDGGAVKAGVLIAVFSLLLDD